MTGEILFFTIFIAIIISVLLIDLLLVGRKSHEVSAKEAAIWSGIWIAFAMAFAVFLRFHAELIHGIANFDDLKAVAKHFAPFLIIDENSFKNSLDLYRMNTTINFLSGYLIEKSLSVDNLFVMMAILNAFSVKKKDYKPVLFWGIIGAIVMRFIFIFAGAALINKFEWILYIFGIYLLYAGVQMYLQRNNETQIEHQNHPVVKHTRICHSCGSCTLVEGNGFSGFQVKRITRRRPNRVQHNFIGTPADIIIHIHIIKTDLNLHGSVRILIEYFD